MFYSRFIIFLVAFFAVGAVHAEKAQRYNHISLNVSAEREIVPDLIRITLYSEARDKDAARLAQATTKTINAAIEKARLVEGVAIQSGNRNTQPIGDKEDIIWEERAELHLESRDFAALGRLSAQLLEELKMADHYFLISKPLMRETENQLIEEAIAAFNERAQILARSLGSDSYKILQLHLDSQGNARPVLVSRAMNMVMAANNENMDMIPHIEAGLSEVVVRVSGMIELPQ